MIAQPPSGNTLVKPADLIVPKDVNARTNSDQNGYKHNQSNETGYGNGYGSSSASARVDVKIPESVVEEGIEIVREALNKLVEVSDLDQDDPATRAIKARTHVTHHHQSPKNR
jgi:hypothetical protein